ncbi:MAG: DNA modification methylase [Sphingomonadaceae bacterium]
MTLPPSSSVAVALNANAADRLLQKIELSYGDPRDLKLYHRELRLHTPKQLDKMAGAMRAFGFVDPVLVGRNNEVIDGSARIAVAIKLGIKSIPQIVVGHLDDTEQRLLRLGLNRLQQLGEFNMKELRVELLQLSTIDIADSIELTGFDHVEIDNIISQPPAGPGEVDPADENVPQPPVDPVARRGDLWLLGRHRLLCGSALDVGDWGRLMAGSTAIMCFADIPFNVPISGHVSGTGRHVEFAMASGEMSETEYIGFITQGLEVMIPHMADGAIIDICIDWRHQYELLCAARAVGLSLKNLCVWNKSNGGQGSMYRSKHELVLIFKNGNAQHINNVMLGKYGRSRNNVWDYAGVNSFGKTRDEDLKAHPTVKPLALVADAIRDVSHRGQIVVDGFMGSGTTLLAAHRTGRIGYGIEIAPGYVDVAIQRWQKLAGAEAVLEETGETYAQVKARRAGETIVTAEPESDCRAEVQARPRRPLAA